VTDSGFSGSGNARTGAPIRGAIADAGFGGSGAAKGSSGNRGAISDAGFSAAASAPKTPPAPRKPADQGNIDKPVEITLKPRPDYTDEARKMRIEGEVLLRVLFTASGEARVLDLIDGLPSGLNENAKRAAERIQFKPAQRQGQPVDSTAIVHIVFQLAY
jgi:TonB family protein